MKHGFTMLETKMQSKQWVGAGEKAPKKAITVLSAVMATVFCDSRGVMLIDHLEKGRTAKRPHLAKKKVFFHHDDTLAHTSKVVDVKLHYLSFEVFHMRCIHQI